MKKFLQVFLLVVAAMLNVYAIWYAIKPSIREWDAIDAVYEQNELMRAPLVLAVLLCCLSICIIFRTIWKILGSS